MEAHEIEIFSPEERSEITSRIEAASSRDAVAPPGIPSKTEAKRRGLFPLLVNAGALFLLAAGLFLLFSFQQTDAAEIRESGAVLGITERALIREIRSEANFRLGEKDAVINAMHISSQNRAEIEAAKEELAKLSGEAEKTALVENQLSGFYTIISRKIETGQFQEAANSVAALKEFLAAPPVASLKTIQNQRESDAAAINALSALILAAKLPAQEAQKTGSPPPEPPPVPPGAGAEEALRKQVAAQAASIAELDRQLESLRAQIVSKDQIIESQNRTILNAAADRERRQNQ